MEIITYVNLFSFIFYFFVTILGKKKRCSLCCTNGSRKALYSKKSSTHIFTDLRVIAQKVIVGDASITQKTFGNEQIVEITTDAHRPTVIIKYGPTSSFDTSTSVISEKYHSMSDFVMNFVVNYLQKMKVPQKMKMVKQKITINESPRKKSQRKRKKKIKANNIEDVTLRTLPQNALEVNSDINKIVTPINFQDKSTFVDEKDLLKVMGNNERQHAILNSLPIPVKEEPNCDDYLSLNNQVLSSYHMSHLELSTNYNTEDINRSDSFLPALSNKKNISKFNNDIKEPVQLTNSVSCSSVNVSKDSCKNGDKISCETGIKEEHEKSFFCKNSKESVQNFTSKEQHEIDHTEGKDVSSDEQKPFQLLNEEKSIGNITENENFPLLCRICGKTFVLLSAKYQHEESHKGYWIGRGNKIFCSLRDIKVDEKKKKKKKKKRMRGYYVNHQSVKNQSAKQQSVKQECCTNVPIKFR